MCLHIIFISVCAELGPMCIKNGTWEQVLDIRGCKIFSFIKNLNEILGMISESSVLFILKNTMHHRNSVSQNTDILFSTTYFYIWVGKMGVK